MSKTHILPIVSGTTRGYRTGSDMPHSRALAFGIEGTAVTGTVTIQARFPGASYFEAVPDAVDIPLAAPFSVQFNGPVTEYMVTIAGIANVTSLTMTDTTEE